MRLRNKCLKRSWKRKEESYKVRAKEAAKSAKK